jgi:hypothetical protein
MSKRITYYTIDHNYKIIEEFYYTDEIKNLENIDGYITFENYESWVDESCFGNTWRKDYFEKKGYSTKQKAIIERNKRIDESIKYHKKEIKKLKELKNE